MAEKLTIQFSATGDKALIASINALNAANIRLIKGEAAYIALQKKLQLANKQTSNSFFGLNHKTRNTASAFSTLRSQMLLASFAILILAKPLKDLMKAVSNMEEILSKANVVFGDNIGIVKEWASALGSTVGRANSTLIEMASTLQDTFVPLGYTREAATHLSTSLTKLALDVASFNNQSDDEVLKAFQSAIVGNHETVRKYGIVITEGKLKQEAFNLGISSTIRELTAAEKVQARVSLITKGSADSVGDLVRTQDSLANQVKALGEDAKRAYEEIGAALEPVLRQLVIFGRAMADPSRIKAYVRALALVSMAWIGVAIATGKASKALVNFTRKASVRTFGLVLLAMAIGEIIYRLSGMDEEAKDLEKSLDDLEKDMKDLADTTGLLSNVTSDNTAILAESTNEIKYQISIIKAKTNAIFEGFSIEEQALKITKERTNGLENLSESEERYLRILNGAKATLDKVTAQRKAQLDIEMELFGSDLL